MSWASGDRINTTLRMRRISEGFPASYTVWRNTATSPDTYWAECHLAGGLDFGPSETATTVIAQAFTVADCKHVKIKSDVNIDSKITVPQHKSLSGIGSNVLTSTITDGSNVIEVAANSWRSTISHFILQGNGSEGDGIHWNQPVRWNKIANVEVLGVGGDGIEVEDGYDIMLDHVWVDSNGGNGIHINDCNTPWMYGITARTNTYGVYLQDSVGGIISGGEFGANTEAGIYLDHHVSLPIIGAEFEEAKLCIELTGSPTTPSHHIGLYGNYFRVDDDTSVCIKIDYAGAIWFDGSNFVNEPAAKNFNITSNAGGQYYPIVIFLDGSLGTNNSSYVIHYSHHGGAFHLMNGSVDMAGNDVTDLGDLYTSGRDLRLRQLGNYELQFDGRNATSPGNQAIQLRTYNAAKDADTERLTITGYVDTAKVWVRNAHLYAPQYIEAHTGDDMLDRSEVGSMHTNLGASGAITLTLPQDAIVGDFFEFVVMAAQELRVDPGAAGAIYINGAKQTDDKYITANDEGESVKLMSDGNGDWVALYAESGDWGVEA